MTYNAKHSCYTFVKMLEELHVVIVLSLDKRCSLTEVSIGDSESAVLGHFRGSYCSTVATISTEMSLLFFLSEFIPLSFVTLYEQNWLFALTITVSSEVTGN